jgi:hypothetical protein
VYRVSIISILLRQSLLSVVARLKVHSMGYIEGGRSDVLIWPIPLEPSFSGREIVIVWSFRWCGFAGLDSIGAPTFAIAVAGDFELQDGGVVHEPIDRLVLRRQSAAAPLE